MILGTLVPERRLIISAVGIGGLESLRKWISTAICAVLARLTRWVPETSWSPAPVTYPQPTMGSIGMVFIGPFPKLQGYDYLWVVICRMTSMVHLIPVNTMIKASELVSIYIKEIVRLHRLPDTIVSNCDPKFTSKFWKETHRILGTKLLMSTVFHPRWMEHLRGLIDP